MKNLTVLIGLIITTFTFAQTGGLTTIAKMHEDIEESSAIEMVSNSKLLWTLQDSGNDNVIYGLNKMGNIIKTIEITNIKNRDWEELTSDKNGALYIGDFGNNARKRNKFSIYKVANINNEETTAETIQFKLPRNIKSKDFEAFFLYENNFYIFSKERKEAIVVKVPNTPGLHTAMLVNSFKLKGKRTRVTAADISDDGKKIVLLGHNKIWLLSNFIKDNFFDGDRAVIDLGHKSQKEGITFKDNNTLYITDETKGKNYGNIYSFKLN
ncbi:MAG TPA: SdiA-regulated domain-containing protein [Flavobacteriaceae bacterium]|nr:SdiA-regulated domain-containing protein [Flavobacteriaceae bacterium]